METNLYRASNLKSTITFLALVSERKSISGTLEKPSFLAFLPARASEQGNWASEASPTLGCSIEISRDIMYIYILLHTSPAHCTFFNDA